MTLESITGSSTPPRVTGDVDIARFPSPAHGHDRWRVSIGGRVHFLTDPDTARRIFALAHGDSYAQAYDKYSNIAGSSACAIDSFIAWSERHRTKLEELAVTPDGHPLKFRRQLLGQCSELKRFPVKSTGISGPCAIG